MATVDATMMKVQRILTGPMGLRIQLQGDLILVFFQNSSTHVNVRVVDWGKTKDGEPRTLVHISSPVLRGLKPSPELYEWVAKDGTKFWFGHMQLFEDQKAPGTLLMMMAHTLLGDYLDEAELSSALFAVLGSADEWDDKLQARFGGKRGADN